MAENDAAVYDLGNAYLFFNDVGAATPTFAEIEAFSAATFGAEAQTITVTGAPTGGTFTITTSSGTTAAIPYNATAAQIKTALVALAGIDERDVTVTGGALPATPVVVTWTGKFQGAEQTLMTADDALLTGGTTPEVTIAKTTLATGWVPAGHTSLDNDFAPFYDGGESTTRGTRQNANLRTQVATATEGVDISFVQVDNETLRMFYGGGEAPSAGVFELPDSSAPIEKAALMVYLDGERATGWMRPKVSAFRNGAIRDAKGGWLEFPIRLTFLQLTGRKPVWYGEEITDDTP
jgi:hypothetical protein